MDSFWSSPLRGYPPHTWQHLARAGQGQLLPKDKVPGVAQGRLSLNSPGTTPQGPATAGERVHQQPQAWQGKEENMSSVQPEAKEDGAGERTRDKDPKRLETWIQSPPMKQGHPQHSSGKV